MDSISSDVSTLKVFIILIFIFFVNLLSDIVHGIYITLILMLILIIVFCPRCSVSTIRTQYNPLQGNDDTTSETEERTKKFEMLAKSNDDGLIAKNMCNCHTHPSSNNYPPKLFIITHQEK